MQYKITSLRLKNFKCFDEQKFYEFCIDYDKSPIILSGPNGYGKTTFFDAVELIFSKDITRLDKNIEKRNTNLEKNILLNKADEDGYVVLTMRDKEEGDITLFAKILHDNHKLDLTNSILYGNHSGIIETDKLDDFLGGYMPWEDNICASQLKYKTRNFNVYYYISQAESVHFLKKAIADRKDAMSVLLNTDTIDRRKETIIELIGNRSNSHNVIINDAVVSIDNNLQKLAITLKAFLNSNNKPMIDEKVEYVDLGLYEKDEKRFFWDGYELTNRNIDEIRRGMYEIKRLLSFRENESDYRNYQWNKEILKILRGNAVQDYVDNKEFIINNTVSLKAAEKQMEHWDKIIQIYNSSLLFRQEVLDASCYRDEDITTLKKFVPELEEYDFKIIKKICDEIVETKKRLSVNQMIISKLAEARDSLKKAHNEYAPNSSVCPFCNTKFKDSVELNDGFEEVNQMLVNESGIVGERLVDKTKELEAAVEEVRKILALYTAGRNDNDIKELIHKKNSLKEFIGDVGRVESVRQIIKILAEADYDPLKENSILDLQRVITSQNKAIQNREFNDLNKEYKYEELDGNYGEYIEFIKETVSVNDLEKKYIYLEQQVWERENYEINSLKEEMKQLIKKKCKLEKIRAKLTELKKAYDDVVNEYKNTTLNGLRVPLLIYTGKILQDYQGGLGVFINKDEMRFVANGEAKHDILNTFSSGQLSGFVLAFLFAMNKRYIKPSVDDLGFILVDDPVQTMDDINISSFVEVLRNDFSKKQIIMSTHEMDKENYILYKFYKYGMPGQSFNVKEKLYGDWR